MKTTIKAFVTVEREICKVKETGLHDNARATICYDEDDKFEN